MKLNITFINSWDIAYVLSIEQEMSISCDPFYIVKDNLLSFVAEQIQQNIIKSLIQDTFNEI